MNTDEKETKKSSDAILYPSAEGELAADELERCFDDILSRIWPSFMDWAATEDPDGEFPAIDVADRDHEIEVRAAVPGVDIADLHISISNRAITIRGIRREESLAGNGSFSPDQTGSEFKRTVPLPDHVMFLPNHASDKRVKASLNEDVLTVILPKHKKSLHKSLEISE